MSDETTKPHLPAGITPLPEIAAAEEIDRICSAFDAAWRNGEAPQIEAYLELRHVAEFATLLAELLAVEKDYHSQGGTTIDIEAYAGRFPEHAETVRRVLQQRDAANIAAVGRSDTRHDSAEETRTNVTGSSGRPRTAQFGDYELQEEIARGGMGIVYKARQSKLDRIVALKMIRSGDLAGKEEIQRFQAEAEAAARLDHPNIVPIHEVGEHDGLQFFSMGYVDGQSLSDRLKGGPLTPREAAGLTRTIAGAVEYAHGKGIVHRDLKPGNILLEWTRPDDATADGTEPADSGSRQDTSDCRPRITDFGLAKVIAADDGMTATGQVLGTPSYMPPEQATGDVPQIGPRSDVYSLGAVLYCTLTGRPPFQSANPLDTLKQVVSHEPVSPRVLNPTVDKDLETICLKCLAKEPAKRYTTAQELADDLARFLNGEPILARPIGTIARAWRWCRRNAAVASIGSLAILFLLIGTSVAWYLAVQRQAALDQARQQTAIAEESYQDAVGVVHFFLVTISESELLKHPGMQPLRKSLLTEALAYYRRFIDRRKDDPRLRYELAQAHVLAGRVTREISSIAEARREYQQALGILDGLLARDSDDPRLRKLYSECSSRLAHLEAETGDYKQSIERYKESIRVTQSLLEKNSDDDAIRTQLLVQQQSLNDVYRISGETGRAIESLKRSLKVAEECVDSRQRDFHLAKSYSLLADSYRDLSQSANAIDACKQAIPKLRRLISQQPGVRVNRELLAAVYYTLSSLEGETGQRAASLKHSALAIAECRKLVDENPSVGEFRVRLAAILLGDGLVNRSAGRSEDSRKSIREAEKLLLPLVSREAENVNFQVQLATACMHLAIALSESGEDSETTVKAFERAIDLWQSVSQRAPKFTRCRSELGRTFTALALHYKSIGTFDAARKALDAHHRAIQEWEAVARLEPDVPNFQSDLALAYGNYGTLLATVLQYEKKPTGPAMEYIRKALEKQERLAAKYPTVVEYAINVAGSYCNQANRNRDATQYAAALDGFDKAHTRLNEVLKRDPKHVLAKNFLRNTCLGRGRTYLQMKRYREAIPELTRAVELTPQRPRNRSLLGYLFRLRGEAHMYNQNLKQAIEDFTRSLKDLPNEPVTLWRRGVSRRNLKQYDAAIDDFTRAIELSRGKHPRVFVDALYGRGYTYHLLSRLEPALRDYSESIDSLGGFRSHMVYRQRYFVREALGDFSGAIADAEKAVEVLPDSADYRVMLAWLLATSPFPDDRDGQRALRHARKACELSRYQTWYCLTSLAAAHAELGDFAKAVLWQQKARAIAPAPKHAEIDQALRVYRAGKPFREPVKAQRPARALRPKSARHTG